MEVLDSHPINRTFWNPSCSVERSVKKWDHLSPNPRRNSVPVSPVSRGRRWGRNVSSSARLHRGYWISMSIAVEKKRTSWNNDFGRVMGQRSRIRLILGKKDPKQFDRDAARNEEVTRPAKTRVVTLVKRARCSRWGARIAGRTQTRSSWQKWSLCVRLASTVEESGSLSPRCDDELATTYHRRHRTQHTNVRSIVQPASQRRQ